LIRSQGHGHRRIIAHVTAGPNIDLAPLRLELLETAELSQELWVIEQFNIPLNEQVLQIGENVGPCLWAKSVDFIKNSELQ